MDPMISYLLPFFMVLTRISGMFLLVPVFSWRSIPMRLKISLAVLVAIFFTMFNEVDVNGGELTTVGAVILLASEGLYGVALGMMISMLFSAVKMAGRIIERQMGLAMAETFDPLTGEGGQPLSLLLEMIFILLFFSADGHHLFLLVINNSFESFPVGFSPSIAELTSSIIETGTVMLSVSLRLAGPILAAFLALMAVLGIFARVMPDMNILFISLPLRVGMGILAAAFFIPFINSYTSEFADWLGKLLPI